MLFDGVPDILEIPTGVLSVLERPPSFWVESLPTIFYLVMSTFSGEKLLEMEKSRNLWYAIVDHVGDIIDKENSDAGAERSSPMTELLLEYVQSDSRRVGSST